MPSVKLTWPFFARKSKWILFACAIVFCLSAFYLFKNIHTDTGSVEPINTFEEFLQVSPVTNKSHYTRRKPDVGSKPGINTSKKRDTSITMRVHQKQPTIFLWHEMTLRFHQIEACPYDCLFTSNMSHLEEADFVMIHAIDLRNDGGYRRGKANLPRSRPPHQYWVFVNHESPVETYINVAPRRKVKEYEQSFNLTMTYMSEADIHIPYGEYRERDREHREYKAHRETANSESTNDGSVLVLWFVSHCEIPMRREYALELNKHIKIDVLGYCTGRHDPCKLNETCVQDFTRKYKFYLSFENRICKEYITEKFWKALRYGLVPIAFGANISDYQKLAPPNSFIHVDNFTSPEHLADYLKYLDKNPEVYNAYHTWREKYEIRQDGGWWWWSITRKYESGENGMWCKACEKAHKIQGDKKQVSLTSNAWSETRFCTKQTPNLYKFRKYTPDDSAWTQLGADPLYKRKDQSKLPVNYVGRYDN